MITFMKTNGAIAAAALIAGTTAVMAADTAPPAVPNSSIQAMAKEETTPKPEIAIGLAVLNHKNVGLGKIQNVVTRGNEKIAIMTVGLVTGRDGTKVAVPLDALKVENGVVVYDKSWDEFVQLKRLGSRDPAEAVVREKTQ